MLGERADNIALRQDADNAVIGAEDYDCADASLSQQFYRRGEVSGRLDRDHVSAPATQNVLDDHGSLPGCGSGRQARGF